MRSVGVLEGPWEVLDRFPVVSLRDSWQFVRAPLGSAEGPGVPQSTFEGSWKLLACDCEFRTAVRDLWRSLDP